VIEIWLQGGPADDTRMAVVGDIDGILGDELYVIPNPAQSHDMAWVVVEAGWPDAIRYVRQPWAEQFDHERIYYPAISGA
jgi:hypothetical protein